MTNKIPGDVQNEKPLLPLAIEKVGVKGVRRRVLIPDSKGSLSYNVKLDAFVDLPGDRRGVHMSRMIEAILETLEEEKRTSLKSLEAILESMCKALLSKHPYAERAEIRAETTQYFEINAANKSPEAVDVTFIVSARRGRGVEWSTGISLEGMTVCPCVQAFHSSLKGVNPEDGLSHTQRTRLSINVRTLGSPTPVDWLVDAAVNAFSAPTLSLLKRRGEYELIRAAFRNPRFIEDVIRHAFFLVADKLNREGFPQNTEVFIEGESYESVHPFNAYACKRATVSEVLRELRSKRDETD